MKGLIYYRINRDDIANVGVLKKCLAQVAAFKNLGVQTDLLLLSDKGILLNDQLIHHFSSPILSKATSKYWFFFFNLLPTISKHIDFNTYDFIYFRYALAHPALNQFLATAKNKNPVLKVIAEMPTYPYKKEKKSFIDRLSLWMDQHYQKKLSAYLDGITHYGLESEILGIPTIRITNGITVHKIPISKSQPQVKKLRLIAVANWSYWHGLDRLIEGLKNYYQYENPETLITLKVIGHGKAIPQYKKLVEKYSLGEQVDFFPPMTNEALDHHFDHADIGIGTLGIHRKNITIDASLKHREYCARGIPFLLAGRDLDFPTHFSFLKKCTPTNEAIELGELITFWEKYSNSSNKLEVRKYAEEHLRWEERIKKVITFIKKNNA